MYSYVRLIIINHSSLSLQVCMFRIISSTINPRDSGMFNLTSTLVDVCNRAWKLIMTEVKVCTRSFELAFKNDISYLRSYQFSEVDQEQVLFNDCGIRRHHSTLPSNTFRRSVYSGAPSKVGRKERRSIDLLATFELLIHELEQIECAIYSRRSVDGRHDADGVGSVVKDAALSADRLHRDVVVHASRAEQREGI